MSYEHPIYFQLASMSCVFFKVSSHLFRKPSLKRVLNSSRQLHGSKLVSHYLKSYKTERVEENRRPSFSSTRLISYTKQFI